MDAIGTAAGITGPAVYRHFSSKDEILATLFDTALDELLQGASAESFPADAPQEELAFLVLAHARFVVDHRQLVRIMTRDDSSLAKQYRRRHQRRYGPYIARWVDCAQRAFPQRPEAETLAAVHGALTLLNSVGGWPAGARKVEDLPSLLGRLALGVLQPPGITQEPVAAPARRSRGRGRAGA